MILEVDRDDKELADSRSRHRVTPFPFLVLLIQNGRIGKEGFVLADDAREVARLDAAFFLFIDERGLIKGAVLIRRKIQPRRAGKQKRKQAKDEGRTLHKEDCNREEMTGLAFFETKLPSTVRQWLLL